MGGWARKPRQWVGQKASAMGGPESLGNGWARKPRQWVGQKASAMGGPEGLGNGCARRPRQWVRQKASRIIRARSLTVLLKGVSTPRFLLASINDLHCVRNGQKASSESLFQVRRWSPTAMGDNAIAASEARVPPPLPPLHKGGKRGAGHAFPESPGAVASLSSRNPIGSESPSA